MLISRAVEILLLVDVALFWISGPVWFVRYKQKHSSDWELHKPSWTFHYDLFDLLGKGEICQMLKMVQMPL